MPNLRYCERESLTKNKKSLMSESLWNSKSNLSNITVLSSFIDQGRREATSVGSWISQTKTQPLQDYLVCEVILQSNAFRRSLVLEMSFFNGCHNCCRAKYVISLLWTLGTMSLGTAYLFCRCRILYLIILYGTLKCACVATRSMHIPKVVSSTQLPKSWR